MKGLIVYPFGLCTVEPNRCNRRLAAAANRIIEMEGEQVVVVAHLLVEEPIERKDVIRHVVRDLRLDSLGMMKQAAEVFRSLAISEVIVVANPFLHLWECLWLARRAGFRPLYRPIGWVGFEPKSCQWYTRGPLRLTIHACQVILTSRRK